MSSSPASDRVRVYFLRTGEEKLALSSLAYNKRPEEISHLEIHSSGLLTVAERREAERALVNDARRAVSCCIQERHYIPRLILSALIFLLVYLFLSLVVRDPIPMVDELLAAALCTALFWVWAMRRDSALAVGSKLLLTLGTKIRSAEVVVDDFLDPVEAYIYDIDKRYSAIELSDILAQVKRDEELPFFDSSLTEDFRNTLRDYVAKREKVLYSYLKAVRKNRGTNEKLAARLLLAASSFHLDLPLLAFLYRSGI